MGGVWLYSHGGEGRNQSLRTFRGEDSEQAGEQDWEPALSTWEEGGSQ